MNLTNKQWIEMWAQIKQIERLNEDIRVRDEKDRKYQSRCISINAEIKSIKKAIQSITGQLE